jgi:hypothetical protein
MMRSTKSQTPNYKQIPITQVRNVKRNPFGYSDLELGDYLGFGLWNLGFFRLATLCPMLYATRIWQVE